MDLKEIMLDVYISFLNATSIRYLCIAYLLFSKKIGIVTLKSNSVIWFGSPVKMRSILKMDLISKDEIHSSRCPRVDGEVEIPLSEYFVLHLYPLWNLDWIRAGVCSWDHRYFSLVLIYCPFWFFFSFLERAKLLENPILLYLDQLNSKSVWN